MGGHLMGPDMMQMGGHDGYGVDDDMLANM